MDAEVGCTEVGRSGWTQRFDVDVGRRVLDTEVGRKGWTQEV